MLVHSISQYIMLGPIIHSPRLFLAVHSRRAVRMHSYMQYVCIYSMYIHISISLSIYIYIYTMCVYTYIYIYIYIYIAEPYACALRERGAAPSGSYGLHHSADSANTIADDNDTNNNT